MKHPKNIILRFKCMKCDHKWTKKKNMKRDEIVGVGKCPNYDSLYYKWVNYEKLFGDMSLEEKMEL